MDVRNAVRRGGSGLSEADAGDWPRLAEALEAKISSIADGEIGFDAFARIVEGRCGGTTNDGIQCGALLYENCPPEWYGSGGATLRRLRFRSSSVRRSARGRVDPRWWADFGRVFSPRGVERAGGGRARGSRPCSRARPRDGAAAMRVDGVAATAPRRPPAARAA